MASFIAAVMLSALCIMVLWYWFVPAFFKGAVEQGLIVAEPSYWTFLGLMLFTTLVAVVVEVIKPFAVALFD